MKIHAESTSANAIQAMAHNLDTICRDLEQLSRLLSVRDQGDAVLRIDSYMLPQAEEVASKLWSLWQGFVPQEGRARRGTTTGEEVLVIEPSQPDQTAMEETRG